YLPCDRGRHLLWRPESDRDSHQRRLRYSTPAESWRERGRAVTPRCARSSRLLSQRVNKPALGLLFSATPFEPLVPSEMRCHRRGNPKGEARFTEVSLSSLRPVSNLVEASEPELRGPNCLRSSSSGTPFPSAWTS